MKFFFGFLAILLLNLTITALALEASSTANKNMIDSNSSVSQQNARILGGTSSFHRAVVSIQMNDHVCTGVIISEKWTLTAASCVVGLSPFIAKIRYGSQKTSWGGEIAKIYKIIQHPQFDATQALNDIAIIETEILKPGIFSSAYLTTSYAFSGTTVNVYGWGTTFESNGAMEVSQKAASVPATWAYYSEGCRNSYAIQNITINRETLLCIGDIDRGGKGICHGDVGAPAMSGSTLYGLASFSYGCGKTGYPGIFTATGKYREWIKAVTGV